MRSSALVFLPLALLSCKKAPVAYEEADFFCPGDPSGICDDLGSRELRVGAAAVAFTPQGFEQWMDVDGKGSEFRVIRDIFLDCGLDQICPASPGYSQADEGEGDGLLNPGETWLDVNADGIFTPGTDTFADCGLDGLCPGDPGYTAPDVLENDGELQVSLENWVDFDGNEVYDPSVDQLRDCGIDGLCPADPTYTAPDEGESDGVFQAAWMAGFGMARAANGVHDDLWARALYLEQGETTIGVVVLDTVGWFYGDGLDIRTTAREELGIDHVIVGSTHVHEAPDTMGIWGPGMLTSGLNADYMARIKAKAVEALRQARDGAVEAEAGATIREIQATEWQGRGVNNFNVDTRDPAITDAFLRILQFRQASDGTVISTIINWPNHPETLSDNNLMLSADFPNYILSAMSEGVDTPAGLVEGVAGVPIYWQGAVGGMQTPLHADTLDSFGNEWAQASYGKAQAIGDGIALMVLESLPAVDWFTEPVLRVRAKSFKLKIVNTSYHIAINAGLFDREAVDWDENSPITDENQPSIITEVDVLDLGPARIATIPGELLPEYWHGGTSAPYPNTGPLQTILDPGNPNPPDLSTAPGPPYLIDTVDAQYPFLMGLTPDEVGYIVPPWQWELGAPAYLEEAPGDHYEETNSVGPDAGPEIIGTMETLLGFSPPSWEP